ncbi:MAG: response regulator [Candidatus Rokubacteria bacterium]|nr:response regulator [Candidatus Rokubacteria bacterium]
MRVLVVEDEQPLCQVFGEFFRGLGYQPVMTHTAEAALKTLESERPDAVLLDIYLPGMSGLEFLKLMANRGVSVPVVAISGIATEAQARECLQLGAVDFVGKPVLLERLGETFASIERRAGTPAAALRSHDRRRATRAAVSLPVWARGADGTEWEGTTIDVSAVGARIRPDGEVRTRGPVRLTLALPDGQEPLEIAAVLARHDGRTYACDFLEATEAQRARLRGLVTRFTWIDVPRREPHVRILHTIAQATGGTLDVDRVLDTALDALTHVTGHELSSLHLLSPDGTTLRLHGERGLSPRLRDLNRVLRVGEGLIGTVAATGTTVEHAEVSLAAELLPAARALVGEEGVRGFVCVPIRSRGRILGTLSLGRRRPPPFSEDEIELVEATASQLGLALENAQLYEATRRQLEGLRHTEDQLAERDRLSTLGKLATGVAHEINTPLSLILGQAELLMTRDAVSPEGVERVRAIIEETSRAARLLQGLLELGQRRPERQPCSLEHQVKAVLELKDCDLRRAGIEVVTSFSPVAPVWGDEDQIRQVLLNLVQNAQQAMAGHAGRRVLTVRVRGSQESVRVEVLDTGPGIPPAILPRVFDAFFTTKPAGEGSGLGLWLSYGIVEQHDGWLRAETRPEGGAAFILDLPYGRRAR